VTTETQNTLGSRIRKFNWTPVFVVGAFVIGAIVTVVAVLLFLGPMFQLFLALLGYVALAMFALVILAMIGAIGYNFFTLAKQIYQSRVSASSEN